MLDFLTVTKALTDENRLRIMMAMRGREMCVCQVTAFLDLAPSTTSKHLSVLRQARLIESTKHGKWVYYRLADPEKSSRAVRDALHLVLSNLSSHPAILRDEERIQEILRREDSICADLDESDKDCLHSLEIHSLETEVES
ncbi:metalloregulator ArsR/SmtB family transcription factor [Desulfovibrio sp. OttesenSCG-928-C06]|nr:metalloregulator ArsR/SmtB family transcription factor [Desulfovibrio sp. OttesenSCG-928-C06]